MWVLVGLGEAGAEVEGVQSDHVDQPAGGEVGPLEAEVGQLGADHRRVVRRNSSQCSSTSTSLATLSLDMVIMVGSVVMDQLLMVAAVW